MDTSDTSSIQSFRNVDIDLSSLVKRQFCIENVVKTDLAIRMCLFQNKLYLPFYDKDTIGVYGLNGEMIQTTKLQSIKKPWLLCPLNGHQLVLASESGLHILDGETLTITSRLTTGDFDDIYVNGDTLAALRHDDQKVYIWDVKEMSQPRHSFPVTTQQGKSTLLLSNDNIYVCDQGSQCIGHTIYQYNMRGECIGQYGEYGQRGAGKLYLPRLCLSDQQGNILVADSHNNKLKVMSADGHWSVLKTKVNTPYDAVIVDGTFYLLYWKNGFELGSFKL